MIDGDLRLLPLHPPIHPPSSKVKKKKTKISVGGEGSISGERKQTTGGRKRREHGTCSSSVPRDAFFYASHFLRFQKRKKKKKNSTRNERLLRRTNQGFFHQEGGGGELRGGGGELRRSSKKILNRAARVGDVEEGHEIRRFPSSPVGGGRREGGSAIFTRESRTSLRMILISKYNILDILEHAGCTRAYVRGKLRFWLTTLSFSSSIFVTCKYRFLYKKQKRKCESHVNEFEPSPLRTTPFCKLSNKTFLRSILSDPDLKRRTMHACNEHRVCRQRHTYTHACTHIRKHTNTYIYIYRDRRKKYPPSSNAFLPPWQAEGTRKETKGAV